MPCVGVNDAWVIANIEDQVFDPPFATFAVNNAKIGSGSRSLQVHGRFTLVTGTWGFSRIDAADQTRYFLHIDALTVPRHPAYAMGLLRTITPVQRWGIGRVRPQSWRLYFKGGWGDGRGWVDHQVALLTRGNERLSVAILTLHDEKHVYGQETLRGIALRLLRGLDSAQAVP